VTQAPSSNRGAGERERSRRLQELIAAEIAAQGGVIPFWRYMELALYAPGLGYYAAGHAFGADGDFVTAPLLGDLFGRCLARQCAGLLEETGQGTIVEFGAGTGDLAAVMIERLSGADRPLRRYEIVELSAGLRERQRETLARCVPDFLPRVQWLDAPPRAICGVIVANEVLDAMPVSRFRVTAQGPREIGVTHEAGGFREVLLDLTLPEPLPELPVGYVSEINLQARAWMQDIAGRLSRGALLVADYGFPRREFYHPQRDAGTLMCHHRHRAHADPYENVGLQDITAHLDFSALAAQAASAGLTVLGYTTQAAFLLALGILDEAVPGHERARARWSAQVQTLTSPSEMGELFKVLAVGRGVSRPLRGFSLLDQTHRL
jgi:SAM-dependent MidA family methyltransferase